MTRAAIAPKPTSAAVGEPSALQEAFRTAWAKGCFVEEKNGLYCLFRRLTLPGMSTPRRVFIGSRATEAGIRHLIKTACA
jgi:hypothetical protein